MLHNYIVAFVFIWHAEVIQEGISGLTHYHGTEELATEPCTAARRDTCFDDGNLEVRTLLRELVSSAQTT